MVRAWCVRGVANLVQQTRPAFELVSFREVHQHLLFELEQVTLGTVYVHTGHTHVRTYALRMHAYYTHATE